MRRSKRSLNDWLQSNRLGHHLDLFEANGIDLDVLGSLGENDLRELGLNLGDRKRLRTAVEQLNNVSPSIHHFSNETSRRIDAERRQITVMFCDLVGSTRLSQKLDPEELRRLIRQYQDVCAGAVARYEGHVAQFLGDGVLVYFGYPKAHENEGERAIRAALDIVARLGELSTEHNLQVRIGIDTGLVVIGQGEALNEQERTAIGDAPNVAARLQGLAQPNTIVISERARQIAGKGFDYADLGTQELKGIDQPQHVYQVKGERVVETRFDAATGGFAAPMVGRKMELDIALKAWGKAKAGKQQVLLLCGEPGIGKSRILRAIRETISHAGAEAWQYQCSPFFANTALYPTIANIERAAGFERNNSPESRLVKLEALLKERFQCPNLDINLIGRLFNLPMEKTYGALQMSPQKQKDETIRALNDIPHTHATHRPLLILFEDIHWADPTTLEQLDQIIKRNDMPALLVLTYRPEFTLAWSNLPHVSALTLDRLDAQQTQQVATRVAGNKPLPQEIIDQIIQKTDGVPLFVEELTKAILETDLVKVEKGHYVLTRQLTSLAIPATLHDSLMARLDRLHPTKEAAQIGACIGREFSHELLSLVSTQTPQQIATAIEQLLASELVFQKGDGTDAIYTFKHALVQDAAYESLLRSKRAEIHARIANTLENQFPNIKNAEPELLAHHYTEAGMFREAVPLWQIAGEMAISKLALPEAIQHFQKVLLLANALPSSEARDQSELYARAKLSLAWEAYSGWQAPQITEVLLPALPLAERAGDLNILARTLWGLWVNPLTQGRVRESQTWSRKLLDSAIAHGDEDTLLVAYMAEMVSLYWLGDLGGSNRYGELIFSTYEYARHDRIANLMNHDPKSLAAFYGANLKWMQGYPDQAHCLLETMHEHALVVGHPWNTAFGLVLGGAIHDFCGDGANWGKLLDRATEIGMEENMPFVSEFLAPIYRCVSNAGIERSPHFVEVYLDRFRAWESIGIRINKSIDATLAHVLARNGDINAGLERIRDVIEQIERPENAERLFLAEALRIFGSIHEMRHDERESEAKYLASLDWAREQAAKGWELRTSTSYARLMQSQGRMKEAVELLKPVYDWFTEGFDTKDLKEAKALLGELETRT